MQFNLTIGTVFIATMVLSASVSYGQNVDTARTQDRILHGDSVPPGKGPWAASLMFQSDFSDPETLKHFCGGSFVSPLMSEDNKTVADWKSDDTNPEWLVTAAHCVVNNEGKIEDKTRLRVLGGTRNRTNPSGKGEVQRVEEIIPHPDFDTTTLENDIALLRLSAPTSGALTKTQRASIRLPAPRDTSWINEPYTSVFAQGWGNTETGSDSLLLKEVQLPIVGAEFCQAKFAKHGEIIGNGRLCAGFVDGNFDSCQGDSGGPLVYRSEGNTAVPRSDSPVLMGVVSWGIGCGRSDLFGVYTTASVYRKWLEGAVVAHFSG